VLIIDDDAMTTDQFARLLRLDGCEVETALDSETGFRAAVSGGFDAVILDLRMPLVDGLELLRQLLKGSVQSQFASRHRHGRLHD
jgi:DNA-binding response OmpR family regulator